MERLDSNQYQGMVEDQDNTSNAPKAKKSIRITTTDSNLERLVEITNDKRLSTVLEFDLHCFELPNLDLVPTIEEYTRMTRLPIDDNVGVYSYRGRYVDERKIAKLIGLHPDQLKLEKRGAIQGLRKSFLEDHLEALAGRGSWHYFNKTLALTIYGLTSRIIRSRGQCPWYSPYEVIFSCGDFANVPLMGPRGCVAYTPSIALRQLKRTQVKPVEEQLGGICFQYDVPDASQLLVRVRAAWRNVQRKGDDELGKPRVSASQEYNEWRRARGVPEYVLREAPHAEAKRKKQEADEAIEGWRLRTNVQRDKKKSGLKRCDDMADCVNYHSIELARRLGEAEDEIDRNPEIQLPPKTARFMRYCQDLARGFGREPKCLM
ncbi:hypothetical protein SESBI_04559 [Sesbania bispinosa]|nr:hypothetical protein SESBI_04559 [Sesbania bispinosa]